MTSEARAPDQDGVETSHVTENQSPFLQHLPLIATIAAFAVLAIRIGRVSGSDVGTTLTPLSKAGLASVLVGTFIGVLPAIAIGTVVLLNEILRREDLKYGRQRWLRTTEIVLVSVWLLVLPWWAASLVLMLESAYVVVAFRALKRKRGGKADQDGKSERPPSVVDWVAVTTGLLIALFSSDAMWLPTENVALSSGDSEVAFVLESDSTWTTLLLEKGRTIRMVRTETVESRTVCDLNGAGAQSLADFVDSDPSDNPECPDS